MDISKRKHDLEEQLRQVQAAIVRLEKDLQANQQAQHQLIGAIAAYEEILREAASQEIAP